MIKMDADWERIISFISMRITLHIHNHTTGHKELLQRKEPLLKSSSFNINHPNIVEFMVVIFL